VLRLGDILPRVPPDLLKPGPHDATLTVHFTIEELAEKIARGRVSVPLERLASAFPGVFRDYNSAPGETDVPLPLQRLLDQVGLVARKAAAKTAAVPVDQVAQARAEAGRIIEANSSRPVPEFATAPSVHSVRIAKAIFTARQVFGLFPKPSDTPAEVSTPENLTDNSTKEPGIDAPPVPLDSATESTPAESVQGSPPEPKTTPLQEPATLPLPAISLRALPIFRLLPLGVLKFPLANEAARVALPLAAIEPQLAGGHVEVPLEDFIKALPEELRGNLALVPGAQVWIPLDEIFQNLPPDHPFHMPPLDLEPGPAITAAELPPEVPPEKKEEPAAAIPPEPVPDQVPVPQPGPVAAELPVPESSTEPSAPADAPANQEPQPVSEPNAPSIPAPPENTAPPEPLPAPAPAEAQIAAPAAESTPVPTSEPAPEPAVPEAVTAPEPPPAPVEKKEPEPVATPEPEVIPEPVPILPPGRAPWMRGFQVPPPRVFATAPDAVTGAAEPAPATPPEEVPPPAAPTPEAKRTADFLASQPGIFAAAAFVEGAVFASEDFPRKPDLDALRDFMGTFIGLAEACGRRLGWNRTVSISCEQFHMTAVVRERHFVVALHHDRSLPPVAYDALVLAADDLSKTSDSAS